MNEGNTNADEGREITMKFPIFCFSNMRSSRDTNKKEKTKKGTKGKTELKRE